jgi:diguanylate cyclase (GGDEF)-like protein
MNEKATLPKILCVDDENSILQALERLLKGSFQMLTAISPHAGLALLRQHADCAVVISDYRMPQMNGVEFLRQVRALYPQTSRAILSGQMDLQAVSDALNASDIHKFFLKPWENEYLLVQIVEAVQMHQTLKERAHFEYLSNTDPVTQLTNHRFFQAELRRLMEQARGSGENVTLILFDVDHFKTFNDRFGHPEGDRLLFSIANQLKKLVGDLGQVSRYGGEEFTVIYPKMAQTDAFATVEKIRAHFESTPFIGLSSGPTYVTLSGGLACFPTHGSTANEIIECADRAMYQAKRQGRNQVSSAKAK